MWLALDDATVDNGCLWVIPGSHRSGILHPVRDHGDPRFDPTPEAHGFDHHDDAIPVELGAGSAVVFDGYLLHRSLPNTRPDGLRRALVNHQMSAESLLPWSPPDPARHGHPRPSGHPVGRNDPYAARGTTDVMRPRLRPTAPGRRRGQE